MPGGAGSSIRPLVLAGFEMAQWTSLLDAVLAVLPPATVFLLAYGRYDGTFRDNVVFLYYIGGLLMGGLLGLLSLLVLGSGNLGGIVAVLLLALFYPIMIIMGVNRRKWQGSRHAVFNGGAFGLGVATMSAFTFLFFFSKQAEATPGGEGFVLSTIRSILFASALTGLFFGIGLLGGNAVRRRAQLRTALMGTAILIAPSVFLVEYVVDKAWLWLALLLAYAAILAVLAERRILIEGVEEEARKQRRRIRRRDA